MKVQLAFLALCAVVAVSEGFRVARDTETDNAEQENECCYPKPERKERGFKKQAMERCCSFPMDEVFGEFAADRKACKEEMKKQWKESHKKPAEDSTSTTTSTAGTPESNAEQFDAEDVEMNTVSDDESDEVEEKVTESAASTTEKSEDGKKEGERKQRGHHHGHHKGGKHHHHGHHCPGKAKCMRETMEKHNWSKNGTINWDAIAAAVDKGSNEQWKGIVKEAITTCQSLPIATQSDEDDKKIYLEKHAMTCIINNSIMKCPNFPTEDEYCQSLAKAHEQCSTKRHPLGPGQFRWCKKDKTQKTKKA